MKYFLFLILTSTLVFQSFSQENEKKQISSYYLIRHAEKDRSNPNKKDPHLTEKGLKRAQKWANTLKHVKFDAIYSTDYFRTKETAQPIAQVNRLEINYYNPKRLNLNVFLEDTLGKTVLVVGHSNSIPNLVNSLIGVRKYSLINDTNNSNLYIVIKQHKTIFDQILVVD